MSEIEIPEGLVSRAPCVLRMLRAAYGLSARYFGLPVYLVGGAVTDPEPRDIDIVVPIPDDLFAAMYCDGDPGASWSNGLDGLVPNPGWRLWARDCAKQSRQLTMYCCRSVDFKTQTRTTFDKHAGPRVALVRSLEE